jgi:peptidoglycan/xylan/chitin deacetylase (PgdA/CDA1 family)
MRLRSLRSAPLAVAYWAGIAGGPERARSCARILMLHGTPASYAPGFERQLRFLKRHFEIVSLMALVDALESPTAPLRRKVAITFDDGLRSNVEVAYPVLKRLGVPATFFVCPELIERGQWLWNHEMRQRLLRLASLESLAAETGGPAAVEPFVTWMKTLPLAERERIEAAVRAATPGFAPTPTEKQDFDLAGWEALRKLDRRVVTLGSHTLSHPILTSLNGPQLEREVAESRRTLEARLDRPVNLFAYPNGDHSAAVRDSVRRHYRAAVSVEEGWVGPLCDPHLLPRVSAPSSALKLALLLHRPMPQPMAGGRLRPIFA